MNEPIWLVVLTILKNISQWEGRIIPYTMESKKMFETTNQLLLLVFIPYVAGKLPLVANFELI